MKKNQEVETLNNSVISSPISSIVPKKVMTKNNKPKSKKAVNRKLNESVKKK
jgi:hypothetical protein